MNDKVSKFFERERFCEVYVGTIRKCSITKQTHYCDTRTIIIQPDDKDTKWLIIVGFLMDLPIDARVEICCFNGSLQLASRKSNNYVITNAQILNIEILNKRLECFMDNVGATYEQELLIYIERIKSGSYGFTKSKRQEYLRWARYSLSNLRQNKKSDPERFERLNNRREEIRQLFLNTDMEEENPNLTELQSEHWDIGEELITRWQEDDIEYFEEIDLT